MNKFVLIFTLVFFAFQSNAKELTTEQIAQAYYKSYTYEKSGNYTDAIKAVQLVYQKYSKAYGINSRLALLYRLNGQYRNSVSHYQQAIKVLPSALSPKLGLMYAYILAKNYEAAGKIGYQVLTIDYYNYFGNLRLANVLRQTDKLDLAEKILVKMLVRYPSDTLYLSELGLLKYQQKDMKRTKAILQDVLILDPENTNAKSILLALEK